VARILLVEDNPDVLVLFEEILRIAGYQVYTGETFQAAQDLLALGEYDLLITDGRLPDGTGVALADKAKEKGIVALIVTGFLDALHRGSPGIEDHYTILQKPLTPNELLAAVGSAIGRAASPKDGPQPRIPHGLAQMSWVDMIATDRE
jgi:DNA-binding response OmpR family regulator